MEKSKQSNGMDTGLSRTISFKSLYSLYSLRLPAATFLSGFEPQTPLWHPLISGPTRCCRHCFTTKLVIVFLFPLSADVTFIRAVNTKLNFCPESMVVSYIDAWRWLKPRFGFTVWPVLLGHWWPTLESVTAPPSESSSSFWTSGDPRARRWVTCLFSVWTTFCFSV